MSDVEQLRPYLKHRRSCPSSSAMWAKMESGPCDCGLDSLLKAFSNHPTDDDVKLTIEEAEQEFGARGHIDATISSHRSVVAVKIDDWILLETREDLRQLLSILPPF